MTRPPCGLKRHAAPTSIVEQSVQVVVRRVHPRIFERSHGLFRQLADVIDAARAIL